MGGVAERHTMVPVIFGDPADPAQQRALPPKWMCAEHGPACPVFPALAAEAPNCGLCGIPLATGWCPHAIITDAQVIMSKAAWQKLVEELGQLRNLEAAIEDAQ